MINKDRIVPVNSTDLLSLISTMLSIANVSYTVAEASDAEGDFTLAATLNSGTALCSEPVKHVNLASGISAITVYFIAAYDYEGFAINGTETDTAGADVEADGRTLYKAVLSSGTITVSKVGA